MKHKIYLFISLKLVKNLNAAKLKGNISTVLSFLKYPFIPYKKVLAFLQYKTENPFSSYLRCFWKTNSYKKNKDFTNFKVLLN